MSEGEGKNEFFKSAHMIILVCFTVFSCILIGEAILLKWEVWALFLVGLMVVASWVMHIQQVISPVQRLWIYSVFMMGCAFFYGTHLTSTYDLALVMASVIIVFTITGLKSLITLCQVTYYLTMTYDLIAIYRAGEKFDSLIVTRILLHLGLIAFIGWMAKTIIVKWNEVLSSSDNKISILQNATKRMNDFLANMSHEIRTPINAVIGLTGVCIEKEKDEEIKTNLRAIESAGKRIAEQIGDILDHSEIDMRKIAIITEDYMLSSLLNDIVNQLKPLKTPELELVIDVDSTLPSVMHTDVSKLKKILWHLIANGLKYTKEGGVYVRISRVDETYGINLLIEVTDTGIGMSPFELERITENYYQGNSGRTRSTSGLGLGMTIVSGFVAALNGFMTIESDEGVGTTVRVSIPQTIIDDTACMTLSDPKELAIGAFLHFDKYNNPRVREFYGSMLVNLVSGLKVTMHKVETVENLRKLLANISFTHLFIGEEEYLSAPDYINSLADKMLVIVVAEEGFVLPKKCNVRIMRKPFYCFPVIGFLEMNMESKEKEEGKLCLEGVRALVVDDEPMNLTVALGIFRRYGMIVNTATSGRESVELCRKNDYDIVFMDHMMPEM
ncbi:MAG: hybrid sensor histidine kinase/response regulator, partial [Acetatifactor sp.]|nr:hybrid sensor histidine kinase/response regulator [Acetatifactor sp.]